jgi:Asp-tRNA(Asn)/Glu-tRNA(Gln) amidotransferase A subunit family amidase
VDRALARAEAADRRLAAGAPLGPLDGIPWGAKDLLAVPGARTTWGAKPYETQDRGDEIATVVERLDGAGAVLLAKLTVGELAWGDVWFGGTTKNPWKPEQGSSGSSAGPAAATAAGLCAFAIGTETWGSIVSPGTRCGVTGLRPTFGRVSRAGCMALSWSMDKIGPMARTAQDCAWVFDAIRGADGRDPAARDAPFRWPTRRRLAELSIGFVPALFEEDRTPEAEGSGQPSAEELAERERTDEWTEIDRGTLRQLEAMGVALVPIELPAEPPVDGLTLILTAEAATAFDELLRSGRVDLLVRQERDAWPNVFRQGQLIPAVEYLRANRVRTILMAKVNAIFEKVDVYVTPTYGGNNLLLTNLTGHPQVVVPNGFRKDGTPTSITFTGRLHDEESLLAVAVAWQEATDFHRRRPRGFG